MAKKTSKRALSPAGGCRFDAVEDSEAAKHPLPELFSDVDWKQLAKRLPLTRRQAEIARWICRGYTNGEIARRLNLAPETVGLHTRGLFKRLRVHVRLGVPVCLVVEYRKLRGGKSAGPT